MHYRLGKKPRSRFPAPIQDAAIAYSYLLNDCGYEPSQIIFMGDSAGGNLAAALSIYLVWRRLPLPGKLCLLSPWVDLTESHPSLNTSPIDYIQPVNFYFATRRYVRGDEKLRTSPLVSPEQADWKRIGDSVRRQGQAWPQTFVTWGEFEALRDEGESLARQMAQDGGFGDKVRTLAWKDMMYVVRYVLPKGLAETTFVATTSPFCPSPSRLTCAKSLSTGSTTGGTSPRSPSSAPRRASRPSCSKRRVDSGCCALRYHVHMGLCLSAIEM